MSDSTQEMDKPDDELVMRFDMGVLKHLGLQMYTSLPAVISEYVANAWDAGAKHVEIDVPQDVPMGAQYEIVIEDDGEGMTFDDINKKFLIIARNRRDEEPETFEVDGRTRKVIGSKGIGKLAGFGVAGRVELETWKDGELTNFELDYDKIQEAEEETPHEEKGTYKPEFSYKEIRSESSGTIVKLTDLKRERRPRIGYIRRRLARRFGVIDDEHFVVEVNGDPITADERNLEHSCQYIWNVGQFDQAEFDGIVNEEEGWLVQGWIGTRKAPVPDEIGNGIAIFARGKLVHEPDFYGVRGEGTRGQHAISYMVGEINAEFVDDDDRDLIATDRSSIITEETAGQELEKWLKQTIRAVCAEWVEKRRDDRLEDVREVQIYDDRIRPLPGRQRELVDDFLSELAEKEGFDDETMIETVDYVASGVEYKEFNDIVRDLRDADFEHPEKVVDLFDKWEVLDALALLRLAKGRIETIARFEDLIESDAREDPDIHDILAQNPWLMDPRWDYLDDEIYFSRLLKDRWPNEELDEDNRRIDFICLGDSGTLRIIELKRPSVEIGRKQLRQLEDYVDFVREKEGTDPEGERTITGYIIGSEIKNQQSKRLAMRLKKDGMHVRPFKDLQRIAEKSHQQFIDVFERKAERTGDERLRARLAELKSAKESTSSRIEEP